MLISLNSSLMVFGFSLPKQVIHDSTAVVNPNLTLCGRTFGRSQHRVTRCGSPALAERRFNTNTQNKDVLLQLFWIRGSCAAAQHST